MRSSRATGTAVNPGTTPISYAITSYFSTQHATVIDYATTTINVAPRHSQQWAATKAFTPPGPMLCVLRGVA